MDLAIVSGRGPNILTDIDGLHPLVRDEDDMVSAADAEEQKKFGSQDVRETAIHTFDLDQVRELGVIAAAEKGLMKLRQNSLQGVWIHLDADVLNDDIMPAVEYRLVDGLQWDELSAVLKVLMASGQAVGLNIGIFNPRLDPDGSIARGLVSSLVAGLRDEKHRAGDRNDIRAGTREGRCC